MYNVFLNRFSHKNLELMEEFYEKIKTESEPDSSTYQIMISKCRKAKNPTIARKLFAEYEANDLIKKNVECYISLIQCLLESGNSLGNSSKAFSYCMDFLKNPNKEKPQEDSLLYFINTSLRGMRVYDYIINNHIAPNAGTYAALIEGCLANSKYEEAEFYWQELESEGFEPSSSIYVIMIDGLRKHKKLWLARKYFEKMKAAGFDVAKAKFDHFDIEERYNPEHVAL
eukprot:Pgem_evm1s7468